MGNKPPSSIQNGGMSKDSYGPVTVHNVPIAHLYQLSGFFEPTTSRHTCLEAGWWCWQNVRERPSDIVRYVKYKVSNWLRKTRLAK